MSITEKRLGVIHTAGGPMEKVARCGTRLSRTLRIVAPHDDPRWCLACRDAPRQTEKNNYGEVVPVNVPQPLLCEAF
jgi:hypothetical protein